MFQPTPPAPVWRRLAAITYDGLLLAALWMSFTLIEVILRDAIHARVSATLAQAMLFLIGLAFFGWFWSHGGQTLGMRAWRLQVRRLDDAPLRWPVSALRYMAGLLPVIGALWGVRQFGPAAAGIAVLAYLPCLLDARGRGFNDFIAGTEVLLLPKLVKSVQTPQAPERDDDQQQGGQAG